jgi:thiol-disulfide isomerase/thioredoxin
MTVFRRFTARLTTAALCAGLLTALPVTSTMAAAPVTPADYLWQASVTDVNGKSVSLDQYRGKTVVVNFWASWCNPCVREMPALDKMSRAYAKQGVQFVGVAIDSAQNVQTFEQKVKVGYPIVIGGYGGSDVMRRLGNAMGGLPFTVVIDKHGTIALSHLGEIQPDQLAKALKGL